MRSRLLGEAIEVRSPLAGAHQQRNVALAIAAAVELAERMAFRLRRRAIEEGIGRRAGRDDWSG